VLVNELGPVQDHVAAPPVVVAAVRFNEFPLQSGPLFVNVGVAGGLGSVKTNGPTLLEGQLAGKGEIT